MIKKILRLPGLIDPHVHLRDPGATQKEDFYTGTCAALAGGYTTVLDMPNNPIPIITLAVLEEKRKLASSKVVCDIGFYFGVGSDSFDKLSDWELKKIAVCSHGLKIYLDHTTGELLIEDLEKLTQIFKRWPRNKPVCVHAEDLRVAQVLGLIATNPRRIHFCHVSQACEIELIKKAKEKGLAVTCEVTPHHLFLTEKDEKVLGPLGKMRPPLRKRGDVEALWKNLKVIDLVASDHAPHTMEEKRTDNPPPGVPGLETTLPLLLTAVSKGRLKNEDILRLCFENPRKIFGLSTISQTAIDIDLDKDYIFTKENFLTKCRWSPFEGFRVKGRVIRVFYGKEKVFEEGKVLVKPGFGKVL